MGNELVQAIDKVSQQVVYFVRKAGSREPSRKGKNGTAAAQPNSFFMDLETRKKEV
jgi:hypothetical protein